MLSEHKDKGLTGLVGIFHGFCITIEFSLLYRKKITQITRLPMGVKKQLMAPCEQFFNKDNYS